MLCNYSCSYFPEEEGDYVVTITWSGREIPKSPYAVNVEGFAGDATKVTGKKHATNTHYLLPFKLNIFVIFFFSRFIYVWIMLFGQRVE